MKRLSSTNFASLNLILLWRYTIRQSPCFLSFPVFYPVWKASFCPGNHMHSLRSFALLTKTHTFSVQWEGSRNMKLLSAVFCISCHVFWETMKIFRIASGVALHSFLWSCWLCQSSFIGTPFLIHNVNAVKVRIFSLWTLQCHLSACLIYMFSSPTTVKDGPSIEYKKGELWQNSWLSWV